MDWQPIDTAPKTSPIRLDIWAKRWVSKTDDFEYRRFPDCYWRSTHFAGLPKDWHPTHWLQAPNPPYNGPSHD